MSKASSNQKQSKQEELKREYEDLEVRINSTLKQIRDWEDYIDLWTEICNEEKKRLNRIKHQDERKVRLYNICLEKIEYGNNELQKAKDRLACIKERKDKIRMKLQ